MRTGGEKWHGGILFTLAMLSVHSMQILVLLDLYTK